jgi:hypothetical protein
MIGMAQGHLVAKNRSTHPTTSYGHQPAQYIFLKLKKTYGSHRKLVKSISLIPTAAAIRRMDA